MTSWTFLTDIFVAYCSTCDAVGTREINKGWPIGWKVTTLQGKLIGIYCENCLKECRDSAME